MEGDPRFRCRAPRTPGLLPNFERALSMAPRMPSYVAMADQDDCWYPDKLATLLHEIGDARLVYSDARIVDPAGERLADTYWSCAATTTPTWPRCSSPTRSPARLAVPRARCSARAALPAGASSRTSTTTGWRSRAVARRLAYVDRPLYEYVQHGGAVLGHAAANLMTRATRLGLSERGLRERVGRWRRTFYVDSGRLVQYATMLQMRCGPRWRLQSGALSPSSPGALARGARLPGPGSARVRRAGPRPSARSSGFLRLRVAQLLGAVGRDPEPRDGARARRAAARAAPGRGRGTRARAGPATWSKVEPLAMPSATTPPAASTC